MAKRRSVEVKDRILHILREKPLTYAELERKVNTGFRTILASCEELASYGQVDVKKVDRHPANGRPAYFVSLTGLGQEHLQKHKK